MKTSQAPRKAAVLALAVTLLARFSLFADERLRSSLRGDSAGYFYDPNDRSCDGFPRLPVETAPGTCLGMVLPRGNLIMPRSILQLRDSDDFLLVDMGGWRANNGALYLIKRQGNGYRSQAIKTQLNLPHGLAYGPDGWIYLGETQQISRFKFEGGRLLSWQLAVTDLPRFQGHMHPLTQLTFDPSTGDMFVNSGAPSDHCYAKESADGKYVSCPDSDQAGLGAIYRYRAADLAKLPDQLPRGRVLTASGLRNSMAMVVSEAGFLVQGENSRDFPELEEPYEEINVIDLNNDGFNYGWPYCYNAHATSPEWLYDQNSRVGLRRRFPVPLDCSVKAPNGKSLYQPPHTLMPPHVAPLNMAYYKGSMFPELKNKLLVSWHGHQPTGQRLVAYDVDEKGLPRVQSTPDILGASNLTYRVNQRSGCAIEKTFSPRGGMDQFAPYQEIISGWNERRSLRPKGAPVGFTEARDGSIWIVEDRDNRDVIRLSRTSAAPLPSACANSSGDQSDDRIEELAWRHEIMSDPGLLDGYRNLQSRLIEKHCASCHGGFKETEIADDEFSRLDFLVKNQWLRPGRPEESKILQAIAQTGELPPMPPGGNPQFLGTPEGHELIQLTQDWIRILPPHIELTYAKITLGSGRKIRASVGTTGAECGQIEAGDSLYVDPRESIRPKANGWIWTKAYLLPGDSRLFPGKCSASDGVYYIALKKL